MSRKQRYVHLRTNSRKEAQAVADQIRNPEYGIHAEVVNLWGYWLSIRVITNLLEKAA